MAWIRYIWRTASSGPFWTRSRSERPPPPHGNIRGGATSTDPGLFEAPALARGDGRHASMLKALARVDLLILDDWGLSVLT